MRLARQARLLGRSGGKRDGRAWDGLLKVVLYPYQREGVLFASQAAWDVLHEAVEEVQMKMGDGNGRNGGRSKAHSDTS